MTNPAIPNPIDELRELMRKAQVSGKGAYVEAGQHVLDLDRALFKRSVQGSKVKESWIFEFKVVQSNNPTHEVGQTRSYVENTANDGWLERVKPCLAALCGKDPYGKLSPQDEDEISFVFAAIKFPDWGAQQGLPENFLKGRRVACEGTSGTSRGGTPITNKKWAPMAPGAAPAAPAGAGQ